jgi:hypothetical protein
MRDGFVRRAVKRLALWNFHFNLAVTRKARRWRGERAHLLGGECRRCARCCEAPAIQVGWLTWHLPLLRRAFLWWQRAVNGFVLTERDRTGRTFVFRCTHFDWATRSCDSYGSRPGMCRDYPRALIWQPGPELLPGCGYRAVAPDADQLLAALDRQSLTSEQRSKLRKGLYLEK